MSYFCRSSKPIRLAWAYFNYFSILSLLFTYLPSYLQKNIAFSGQGIALLYSGITVVSLFAQPFWGQLADSTRQPGKVSRWCSFCALGCSLPLLYFRNDILVVATLWLVAFFITAVPPLLDSISLANFGIEMYGKIRVWGSLGYAGAAAAYGIFAFALPATAEGMIIWAMILFLALVWFALIWVGEEKTTPQAKNEPGLFLLDLLKNRRFLLLCLFGFLHWSSCIPYHWLLDLHRQNLDYSIVVTFSGVSLAVVAECLLMVCANKWRVLLAPREWLLLTAFLTALRWALMSYPLPPLLLVLLQGLHGFSFGVFFVSCINYIYLVVPESIRASGLTLFSAIAFGAGSICGNVYGGLLLESPGRGFAVFAVAALISSLSMLAALLISRPGIQQR